MLPDTSAEVKATALAFSHVEPTLPMILEEPEPEAVI